MGYLVSQIQDKVRPELLRRIPLPNLKLITDDEFIDIINRTQSDLNRLAQIHWERYYAETTDQETNYEMARPVLEVAYFYYEDDDWGDQRFTWVNDVIVLKEAPAADIQMDIRYLGDTLDVDAVTDEIDIPDEILSDFLSIVKTAALIQFSDLPRDEYDKELEYRAEKIKSMRPRRGTLPDKGIFRYWIGIVDHDDHVYDITGQWVSNDSVVYDGTDYIFVD